jgi:hypothetical protein
MRSLRYSLTLALIGQSLAFQPTSRFQSRIGSKPGTRLLQLQQATKNNGDDSFQRLTPETSFGSEAVPEAQRPVNEYLDVTSQPMFGWASTESGSMGLFIRLTILYGVIFASVCYPISGASFTQEGYEVQKLASSNVGALLFIFFILLRLYSGWDYIGARLASKVVEYEETGWYDGDFELKPETERKRDKFLYNSNVKPVVERLKVFIMATGSLWVASCVCLNVALKDKPVFNNYDPAVLERVQYDDKLAETAAMNSGGRPTYCDNRYYRAVAGGGQGCD